MSGFPSCQSGNEPDALGQFGRFGGRYMPETLMPALTALTQCFEAARTDESFWAQYRAILARFVGRPTPLFFAENLTAECHGAQIFLKREDLNHTGAHKINHCVGQILLAERMGKRRIVAETGAGQHGVATATVCALRQLECVVYMGAEDMRRQAANVHRMRLLGAEVRPVQQGAATLKEAMSEAIRDWITHVEESYFLLGTVAGPHPYPLMVRTLQRIIGEETREQVLNDTGGLPDALVACVGGGSNAIGFFHPFLADTAVQLYGVEAAGAGLESGRHAAALSAGRPGVLHGMLSYLLQDAEGQIMHAHSLSAGLDYPGVGPEHAQLHESGRVHYSAVTDQAALEAVDWLCRNEGILPALESAHALAFARMLAPAMKPESVLVVCLSGRGDKDLPTLLAHQENR